MPLHDLKCQSPTCGRVIRDVYFSRHENPNPPCECGAETKRRITRFGVVWSKPIEEYGSKDIEGYHKGVKRGGHYVYRKRSGGGTDEAPVKEFITTIQQQRAYCREEGLIPPDEASSVMSINSDGESFSNGCGEAGCWV